MKTPSQEEAKGPVPAAKPKKKRIRHREPNSIRDRLVRWQSFEQNLRPYVPNVPAMSGNFEAFAQAVAEIEASLARQDALTAELRQLVRDRNEAVARAVEMRSKLAGQIIGELGDGSGKLRQFGMKPRRKHARMPESGRITLPPEPGES